MLADVVSKREQKICEDYGVKQSTSVTRGPTNYKAVKPTGTKRLNVNMRCSTVSRILLFEKVSA